MSDIPVIKCKRGKDERFCTLKKVVSSSAESIDLPKYVDGRYISAIGGGAFKKCPRLKTLAIPETVTRIMPKAFAGSNIERIVIPSTVTEIGDNAFDRCVYLRDIAVENPAAKFGRAVFSGCYNIRCAKLPVAGFTGRWFTTVEELTIIGDGEIPENAFKDCDRLKTVTVADGITSVHENAFGGCSNLAKLILPDSLQAIESRAFNECVSLKEFTLPKGVGNVERSVFCGCAIERLRVDKDNPVFHSANDCIIRTADKALVAGCCNSVIPNDGSVEIIDDGAFEECGGLVAVVVPSAVKRIGDGAFGGCSELENIVLSEGVQAIADFAFVGCSHLESVNLPSTLKELGFGVFDECEWMSDVFYNGTIAEWNDMEKDYNLACNSSFTLHCTDGDIDDYK